MAKTLVAYYSRAGENYYSGVLRYVDVGNTETVASTVRELTGADTFKIEQVDPYSKSYDECIAEAQADQRRNARPELVSYPDSLDAYGTIYLGYPNYWGTVPMAVCTFLESFDSTGKVIKPFCTHEGSGLGRSVEDVKRMCPNATVEEGLAIHGSSVGRSRSAIELWVKKGER